MPDEHLATRAVAYGIPGEVVDGQDVRAVHEASRRAVERAREAAGRVCWSARPTATKDTPVSIPPPITKAEEEEWKKRDPIKLWAGQLTASGMVQRVTESDPGGGTQRS